MSSRGQVVIPEDIRKKLGLKTGEQFLVIGDKDVVILKTISIPPVDEFTKIINEARRMGKAAGLRKSDINKAVAESHH